MQGDSLPHLCLEPGHDFVKALTCDAHTAHQIVVALHDQVTTVWEFLPLTGTRANLRPVTCGIICKSLDPRCGKAYFYKGEVKMEDPTTEIEPVILIIPNNIILASSQVVDGKGSAQRNKNCSSPLDFWSPC